MTIQEIPGTEYVCIAEDSAATPCCLKQRTLVWETALLRAVALIMPILKTPEKPNPFVLDVGAYIGDTTCMFLDFGCKVWAFEPREESFYCLEHNCPESENFQMVLGNGENVILHEPLDCKPKCTNLGAYFCTVAKASTTQTVKLDDLGIAECDLLKIDVEGFEPYVLDGAHQLLENLRPLLIVEINAPTLRRNGFCAEDVFERVDSLYNRKVFTYPERVGTEEGWDFLCVPK